MACLLAQELGAQQLTALVQKSETSSLWQKRGGARRGVAARRSPTERIRHYIDSDYESHIVSFDNGAAAVRPAPRVIAQSPVSGEPDARGTSRCPQGLIVAAIVYATGRATIPAGRATGSRSGDDVILFVRRAEADDGPAPLPGPGRGLGAAA